MRGAKFAELKAFATVAERLNFARAAEQLAVSPSALSQTIKGLEDRLGVRLLHRTTPTMALTDAGSRLPDRIAPLFDGFEEINEFRGKTAGTIRICAPQMATLHLQRGPPAPLLLDWSRPAAAFYLYHPSRVQMPAALRAFIDALTIGIPVAVASIERDDETGAPIEVSSRPARRGNTLYFSCLA